MAALCPPRVLRDYQVADIKAVEREWSNGIVRTVGIAATGTGKTDVIAAIAVGEVRAGGRVLILANRTEALDQISERCATHAPDISVGRVQARRNEFARPIVVASVQTVCRPKRLALMLKPTVVIVDECHYALSQSFLRVLVWAGCFENTRLLGVTATLVRSDRQGFGELFQSVAFERTIDWAVRHHWLVKPVEVAVPLPSLTRRRGQAKSAVAPEDTVRRIVGEWLARARDRTTVVFAPNREVAGMLHREFCERGVVAELVVGSTPHEDRQLTYKRLAAGDVRVMVAVMVPVVAWDCPPVSCVLIARSTRSVGLYVQMAGRGLRLSEGKRDCLVLVTAAGTRCGLSTPVDMYPTPIELPAAA